MVLKTRWARCGGGQGDRGWEGVAQVLLRLVAAEGTDKKVTKVAGIEDQAGDGCHGQGTGRPGGEGQWTGG